MTDTPSSNRDARGRFVPGRSGNPAGKKPGTLNRATRWRQMFDEGDAVEAAQLVRARVRKGDLTAARFVLDRVDPKPRGRTITLDVAPAAATTPPAPTPKCVVPRLVGTLARKAKTALKRAHCALGARHRKAVKSPRKRRGRRRGPSRVGRILAQKPAAGTVLAAGSKVRVTVGVRARRRPPRR